MVRGTALGKRENEHIVTNVYMVFCTGPLPLLYLEYWCQKEHKTVLALITMQVVRRLRKNKQLKNSAEDLKKSPRQFAKNLGSLIFQGAWNWERASSQTDLDIRGQGTCTEELT